MRTTLYASVMATILLAWLQTNFASSEFSPDFENIPWPPKCGNRSYCQPGYIPNYYPKSKFEKLLEGVQYINEPIPKIDTRIGVTADVGDCQPRYNASSIYLIKDENNKVRYVAQTDKFSFKFLIEECVNPGKISNSSYRYKTDIHCHETTVRLLFSVLSLDGTKLESAAPSGGIPFSCSAKKMRKP